MDNETLEIAREALQKHWGFTSFREGQDAAIKSVLEKKNTMVLFPTGGGKSLCYQLPSVLFEGLTIVISPLVALMQDQVHQLNERGIAATFVNSTISSWEVEQRLVNARNGMYDLLYCAPERLETPLWEAELPRLDVDLIAIDEAHCISEWGHDFRPSYRQIRPAFESIADSVSWIALTATATPEVRADIAENLGFTDPEVISKGFERPNLKWWVTATEQKQKKILNAVKKAAPLGSGLIYGGTRRNCEELARKITNQLGVKTEAYHAGIESSNREEVQNRWIAGDLPLVVATNAFGMGIDKADCRYVIHYEMPYSLEAYYQQAGRAGRDGLESFPMLLFKPSDLAIARQRIKDSYPEKDQLQHVYDVLCDSLNLAVGAEMEKSEEVSIRALAKRSGYPARITQSALKVLNQLSIIELIEYLKPRVGIQFVASQDYIREQIQVSENQRKSLFLDTLLRQFGGEAFAAMKYLDFDYIQQKLGVSPNAVKKGLQVLQDHDQLLKFELNGEQPMVKLVDERQAKLRLRKEELEQYRNTLLEKLAYMKGYIQTENCREVYIRQYFGEQEVSPCGHCDNCLQKKKEDVQFTNSDLLAIRQALSGGGKTLGHLCRQLGWSKARIKRSLSHLIREEKVRAKTEKYFWVNNNK
ncbi:RecQ family ATP-dependent DNA helicase [Fodinibius salsisoli]|uniref:ATP-dependent DNA helicase RecQ n=1 Tax=Fodinibius salsisoli TaxID=2820877 RepID=A0ABT3PSR5_9BACT|nr:ATP-dependent DNA helicase RecQ [Fodinibius salsisoli]MCW9708893.1 RecQ family ATP-dependent DNA helicase [Fodinibius salsisoli]